MEDLQVECAACGEALTVRNGAPQARCSLCWTLHAVDRSSAPPSIRMAEADPLPSALKRAEEDLKAVTAEIRFFEAESRSGLWSIAFGILGVALTIALGAYVCLEASRSAGAGAGGGTFLMPSMSMEEQNRLARQILGGAMVLAGAIVAFLLPWRRWREPARILRTAREHRAVVEDLIRRLTERAHPPSH